MNSISDRLSRFRCLSCPLTSHPKYVAAFLFLQFQPVAVEMDAKGTLKALDLQSDVVGQPQARGAARTRFNRARPWNRSPNTACQVVGTMQVPEHGRGPVTGCPAANFSVALALQFGIPPRSTQTDAVSR